MKCNVNQAISNKIVYLSEVQFRWNPIELCRNRHVIECTVVHSEAKHCAAGVCPGPDSCLSPSEKTGGISGSGLDTFTTANTHCPHPCGHQHQHRSDFHYCFVISIWRLGNWEGGWWLVCCDSSHLILLLRPPSPHHGCCCCMSLDLGWRLPYTYPCCLYPCCLYTLHTPILPYLVLERR